MAVKPGGGVLTFNKPDKAMTTVGESKDKGPYTLFLVTK